MNSQQPLAKKFDLKDFAPPQELTYEDIVARPIARQNLKDDLAGVNSSIETIQRTRGGSWPRQKLAEDFDFLDLAWHEREFRDNSSFAYVVYGEDSGYIGCFYIYPIGVRTPLKEETEKFDADFSWWVTAEAYNSGYYEKLYSALKAWLKEFPFQDPYFSNAEIPN